MSHLERPSLRLSIDDPLLDPYRKLRERDLVRQHQRFILEGRVVLDAALAGGRFDLISVLVSERRVTRYRELLEQIPEATPIYTIDHNEMQTLVGFNIHRGLLALGACDSRPSAAELLASLPPGRATVLVLEGLTDHDNIGACFRNAAAFGVAAVLLDERCAAPLYRKSIRVSVGHILTTPFNRGEPITEVIAALRAANFTSVALSLGEDARPLDACWRPAPRVALLLGHEGHGLSDAALEACEMKLCIPMASHVDSLNVATSSAVALFAMTRG